jgi:endonuclease/exonuclease/phosphatase family metal-dependent hydrolase
VPEAGGALRALRYTFRSSAGPFTVFSVHLSSPRTALWDARNLNFGALAESATERRIESRAVSVWVNRADSATVVAGDFNLPDGSRALREGWADMTDAFEARGLGFGQTMRAGRFTVRIDHVFSAGAISPTDVRVESGFPSEHRPVVVEYQWRTSELATAATRPPPPIR